MKYLPIQDIVQSPNNNLFQDLRLLPLHNHQECLLCRQKIIFVLDYPLIY